MSRIACALVLCAVSCATMPPVPVVPAWSDLDGAVITIGEDERKLWQAAKEERTKLEKDGFIVADRALTTYLNGVLATLMFKPVAEQAPLPSVQVVRSPQRNAFTLPDGVILVTTSMLAALQNEAQLAALLGHELGHFIARHGLLRERFEKVSRSTVERMQLSRQNETYCDRFALDAMRHAGYSPHEMPRMLQLMESGEASWSGRWSAFRSHPFIPERIRALREDIRSEQDEALRIGARSFDDAIAGLLPIAAEVELKAGLVDRAELPILRHLALRPESGRGYYLKAEYIRLTVPQGRQSPQARRAYERAVELAPDDAEAVRALAFLYSADGETARASVLFKKYLSLAPDAVDRKLIERIIAAHGRAE